MMLFGVNFNCYYLLIMRQFKALFKNEEVRCYFGISIMSAALIAIDIRKNIPDNSRNDSPRLLPGSKYHDDYGLCDYGF